MKVANLSIEGMDCIECASLVRTALERLDGVLSAAVSSVLTVVAYDGDTGTRDELEAVIRRFGYRVREA